MKKYISVLVFMVYGFALASPPQPLPPGPPGLSIDNGLLLLVFVAIFYVFIVFTQNTLGSNKNS